VNSVPFDVLSATEYVTPATIRASWDRLQRHLGRSRAMWAYLLELPDRPWPPDESKVSG
jgi:hypothetical protein